MCFSSKQLQTLLVRARVCAHIYSKIAKKWKSLNEAYYATFRNTTSYRNNGNRKTSFWWKSGERAAVASVDAFIVGCG